MAGRVAYSYQPKKPSLKLRPDALAQLPVLIWRYVEFTLNTGLPRCALKRRRLNSDDAVRARAAKELYASPRRAVHCFC